MFQPTPPEPKSNGPFARQRLPILAGLAAVSVLGVVLVLAAIGGGGSNDAPTTGDPLAPGSDAGLAAEATPVAEGAADFTARPASDIAQNLTSIGEGDRMVIAKAGVDAPLFYLQVPSDGQMPTPEDVDAVAYYDFSLWPGLGGAPGRGGNGVFAGHVDSGRKPCKNGTVKPPCQAVFWEISSLKVGDEVEVKIAGQSHKYRVTSNQPVPADSGPWDKIVSATAQETITLITCSGNFNRVTRQYTDRQVVTAVRN